MRLGLFFLLLVPACHSWSHAPGYDHRQDMTRTQFPIESVSSDLSTVVYDVKMPDGTARIVVEQGSVDVTFNGTHASCDSAARRCSIADKALLTAELLELHPGCTSARLDAGVAGSSNIELRTDTVQVLGHMVPGREISLLDAQEVQVFVDDPGTMLVQYARKDLVVPARSRVALIAFNALAKQCATTLAQASR